MLVGKVLGEPEGALGAGDDGELEEGVGVLQEPGDHPVAALVVGDRPPGLLGYELGLPLHSPDYPLGRRLEVGYRYELPVAPRRYYGRLVAYILNIGPAEARSERGQPAGVLLVLDAGLEDEGTQVDFEDLGPSLEVREVDVDEPVEPARTGEGLVQNLLLVGCCEHDHVGLVVEAVHLHQQLVQSCVPFIVASAEAAS